MTLDHLIDGRYFSHACGSCSMLPQEKNGVVDPKLKVLGFDDDSRGISKLSFMEFRFTEPRISASQISRLFQLRLQLIHKVNTPSDEIFERQR